uniref:Membrane protein ORF51 n=1 Tax=Anguillid herpesvirus 1 TaxID=150286 RepID=A0A8E5AHC7_9VIRU|nr:membrane protein ORF51 [Anguillid herpesvirus 1]QRM16736.1 membrane protein ORF51 [Anguillid herpesvirus 1]QRM17128.1 membrane protein ORF51 [Anguillid herpesvirus 1]
MQRTMLSDVVEATKRRLLMLCLINMSATLIYLLPVGLAHTLYADSQIADLTALAIVVGILCMVGVGILMVIAIRLCRIHLRHKRMGARKPAFAIMVIMVVYGLLLLTLMTAYSLFTIVCRGTLHAMTYQCTTQRAAIEAGLELTIGIVMTFFTVLVLGIEMMHKETDNMPWIVDMPAAPRLMPPGSSSDLITSKPAASKALYYNSETDYPYYDTVVGDDDALSLFRGTNNGQPAAA